MHEIILLIRGIVSFALIDITIIILYKFMVNLYVCNRHFLDIGNEDSVQHEIDYKKSFNSKYDKDYYEYLYEYSAIDKLIYQFKQGIGHGFLYFFSKFLGDFFNMSFKYKKYKASKYEYLMLGNLIILELSRFFMGFVPQFPSTYIDLLLFLYLIATFTSVVSSVCAISERNNIFKIHTGLIHISTLVFVGVAVTAWYWSTNMDISKNSTILNMISAGLMVTPFGFLIVIIKYAAGLIMENSNTHHESQEKALSDKVYE